MKCADSIYYPAAPLLLLWNCCPTKDILRPKKMAIQKCWVTIVVVVGNPAVLGHDCGGCCNTSLIL